MRISVNSRNTTQESTFGHRLETPLAAHAGASTGIETFVCTVAVPLATQASRLPSCPCGLLDPQMGPLLAERNNPSNSPVWLSVVFQGIPAFGVTPAPKRASCSRDQCSIFALLYDPSHFSAFSISPAASSEQYCYVRFVTFLLFPRIQMSHVTCA